MELGAFEILTISSEVLKEEIAEISMHKQKRKIEATPKNRIRISLMKWLTFLLVKSSIWCVNSHSTGIDQMDVSR